MISQGPSGKDATRDAGFSSSGESEQHRRPWWLLLIPFNFLLHIIEEWFAGPGFPAWTAQLRVSGVPPARLLAINAVGWPVTAVFTVLGIVVPEFIWFPAAFATMISINAVLHAVGSVATASYSPGLVTGLLLLFPVGIMALFYCRRVLPPRRFVLSIVAGTLIHAAVIAITFS